MTNEKGNQTEPFRGHNYAKGDVVMRPTHYTDNDVECIDAIRSMLGAGFNSYCLGQVVKYVWRSNLKGNYTEDLEKAMFYLTFALDKDPRGA